MAESRSLEEEGGGGGGGGGEARERSAQRLPNLATRYREHYDWHFGERRHFDRRRGPPLITTRNLPPEVARVSLLIQARRPIDLNNR